MISLILIFSGTGLLAISTIFLKNKGVLYFFNSALTLSFLVISAIMSANYNNNFGGFSIFAISSILPLFLSLFEINKKEAPLEEKIDNFDSEMIQIDNKKSKNKSFSKSFFESEGKIFQSASFVLSSFLFAFSGLYLGKETPFGFLMALPFALIGVFTSLLKNKKNIFDIVCHALSFMSAGFLIGQIITVLIYSFAPSNILFAVAGLVFASYIITTTFTKEKRINILMYTAFLLLCLAILFV